MFDQTILAQTFLGSTVALGPDPQVFDLALADDTAYFALFGNPFTRYRIEVDGLGADLALALYGDPPTELVTVDDDSGPGLNPAIEFLLDDTMTEVLLAVRYSDKTEPPAEGVTAGIRAVELESRPRAFFEDVIGDSPGEASYFFGPWTVESVLQGPADADVAGFYIPGGIWIEAFVEATGSGADAGTLAVSLADGSDRLLGFDSGTGAASVRWYTRADGLHYISGFRPETGGEPGEEYLDVRAGWRLPLEDPEPDSFLFGLPDDLDLSTSREGSLTTLREVDGEAVPDRDMFGVVLEAGKTYTVSLSLRAFGSEAAFTVWSPDVFEGAAALTFESVEVTPGFHSLTFVAPETGRYGIEIVNTSLEGAQTFYDVTVEPVGMEMPDDHGDRLATATSLLADPMMPDGGVSIPFMVDRSGDVDAFVFEGADGMPAMRRPIDLGIVLPAEADPAALDAVGYLNAFGGAIRIVAEGDMEIRARLFPDEDADGPWGFGVGAGAELDDGFDFSAPYTLEIQDAPPPAVPQEVAEDVALIYEAVLDRPPDPEGLNFWLNAAAAGLAFRQIARAFVSAPEFRERFGDDFDALDAAGQEAFVRFLYDTVLGREADPGGLEFWREAIAEAGAEALVIEFARSAENRAASPYVETLREVVSPDLAADIEGVWEFVTEFVDELFGG